jgi:hypothetical protein
MYSVYYQRAEMDDEFCNKNLINIEKSVSLKSHKREQFHRHPHCEAQDERNQRTTMKR